MVSLQEWLNKKYPTLEDKKKVKEIDIFKINREREREGITEKLEGGKLDLREYSNLEWARIDGRHLKSPLTSLDASNCAQLTYLGCRPNQLTSLDVRGCVNLRELSCWTNLLTKLDLTDNHQLEILWASNNNFAEQDLSFLSHLVNLKGIGLANFEKERIQKGIYSRLAGSLEPLKNLTKLERLFIYDTDFDSGLEHLPESLKELYCSALERPKAKIKILEQELRKFGEPNNGNYVSLLKNWKDWRREFVNSPAQQWLDEWYPKDSGCKRAADDKGWDGSCGWDNEFKKREEIIKLDISQQSLKKGLKLEGFNKLENLNCSDNQLTNLDLRNCPNLVRIKCDQNVLNNLNLLKSAERLMVLQIQNNPNLSQDLKIFTFFKELIHLDINNCPFEGSLRPLEDLNNLEWIDISNTNLQEGLEHLPASCKKLYCSSNYQFKSVKIMEELDNSRCLVETKEDRYYDLDKWRISKGNNDTSSIIPLERLFVIRGNLKQFINKWNKPVEDDWYDKLEKFAKGTKTRNNSSEISRLKSPEELNRHRKVYMGTQFIGRGIAVVGVVLTFRDNSAIGGGILGVYPFAELAISNISGKIDARQNKWNEFLDDADNFSDNFNELLGITRGIRVDNDKPGKVNEEFRNLKQKVNEFLDEYDTIEKNREIDREELISRRGCLADDINSKESKLKIIIESMKKLEDQVIAYRQGIDIEKTDQTKLTNNRQQIVVEEINENPKNHQEEVMEEYQTIDFEKKKDSHQAYQEIPPK